MTGPRPWEQEGASDAIAHLLAAARDERPSAESLSRSLAAATVGATTAITTAAAGAALGKLGASSALGTKASSLLAAFTALKWLVVGAALGSAVMATVELPRRASPPGIALRTSHPLAPTSAPAGAAKATGASPALPPLERTESASEAAPAPLERTPSSGNARTLQPSGRAPAHVEAERLADEVRAIDEATRALNSGRARRALTLLDAYERRYAERRFAPEALYLRMEALINVGRPSEARSVANQLVNAYPTSPQAGRARAFLADTIR